MYCFGTMSTSLRLHHYISIDKDNATRGTTSGQQLVCIATDKETEGESVRTVGSFVVFDTTEHAEAFIVALKDSVAAPAGSAAPAPSSFAGYLKGIATVKRSDLHHITSNWKDLFEASIHPPADPRVGEEFKASLPITRADGALVVALCTCKVTAIDTANAIAKVSLTCPGHRDSVEDIPLVMVDGFLGAITHPPPPPPVAYSISWDPSTHGSFLLSLIKRLPVSSTYSSGEVDLRELLDMAKAIDPAGSSSLALVGPPATSADTAAILRINLTLRNISTPLENDSIAKGRAWPSDSASRLGAALKSYSVAAAAGHPPVQHPLSNAFKAKAADPAAFAAFLNTSYLITVKAERHAWAKGKPVYTLMGMLESFLPKCSVDAALIAALPDALSADQLDLQLLEWADSSKSSPPNSTSIINANPSPPNSMAQSLSGGTPLVFFKESSNSLSSQDQSEHNQLRLDAAAIASDPSLVQQLSALITLKDNGQTGLVQSAVQSLKEPRLARLIQFDGDLQQALQGGFPQLVSVCNSLRDTIETKLLRTVLGTYHGLVPDRQQRAFRAARLGRVGKVRLFHLIDQPDYGTSEQPLKQLASLSKERQIITTGDAFACLGEILQFSFIAQQAQLAAFMPQLRRKLIGLLEKQVTLAAINNWLRNIFELMAKPIRRHSLADATVGVELRLGIDHDWLGLTVDFNQSLNEAILQSFGDSTSSTSTSVTGKEGSSKKQQRVIEDLKLQLKRARKSKGGGDDDLDEKSAGGKGGKKPDVGGKGKAYTVAEPDEQLEADSNGKYCKLVPKGHPLLVKWNAAHPQKDGKFVCWAHFNLKGGCPHKVCRSLHKK